MKSNTTLLGILKVILIFILGIIVAYIIMVGLLILSSKIYLHFVDKGKPVSLEDVNYLCQKLAIEQEVICSSEENIYPWDFSLYISNQFEEKKSTYEDAQEILGKYQMDVIASPTGTFFVDYDINNDGEFDVSMWFETNNTLIAIAFSEDID